ncbi:NADP-specific glutamate dehydrogenase [Methylophaga nitratireducenticrescens]|uniref:NADP-specific glutamate dehydrogenase n=1 Tax=Methylophaga nitratireducenticrescens TaxID=754476 RepID=UPI000CDBFC9C|nr:NADP-specific glutamate dehydrogenase [Methylophaga nitratireducenticrescens]AUZ85152.1 glutamate dehydrogenase [Methylophaga nitratireducenticrescens]
MSYIETTLRNLQRSSPCQPEFYQATEEILQSIYPLLDKNPHYLQQNIVERIVEPERQIMFRVVWQDDEGKVQVNKGYRVQFSSTLGPYKGGIRFHPSVNASTIKFLGFEQIFKNALTGLSLGGGKGGSDFDPKNRSDNEVMRFCQAFMTELYRHIGATIDVPAGDIGVSQREIGYLFGQYKRLNRHFEGVLTGKALNWGGSLVRPEATGYGLVYFTENMLQANDDCLDGKKCLVSGAGNVAIHTIEKLYQCGALPITCSDSTGTIHHAKGIDLILLRELKEERRGSLIEYLDSHPDAEFIPRKNYPNDGHAVWRIKAEAAFPCATQNELSEADAKALCQNGITCIVEGANMPCTAEAQALILAAGIHYAPSKAANAGGVATSQLEMAQNAGMIQWSFAEVDQRLQTVMKDIYQRCAETAIEFHQPSNLMLGANIAGFRKVADAMLEQGLV